MKRFGTLKSLKNKVSPISSGGLKVLFSLTFERIGKWAIDTMEELVEKVYSFEYSGNLYSTNDTNDSDDEEFSKYQTITIETEDVEGEIDGSQQIDLEIDKNLDIPIVTDDK